MSARLFYFKESAIARIIDRLPERWERVALPGLEGAEAELLSGGVILVDATADQVEPALLLKDRHPGLEIVARPPNLPTSVVARMVAQAFAQIELRSAHDLARVELARLTRELANLNAIGIKLSAESDTEALVELILTKAREITYSDAGSLYLIEEDAGGQPHLSFRLVQNDSMPVSFKDARLPVSLQSVAGYVALTGQILSLPDAYAPPPGSPFTLDRSFDERTGYRSKSMLVVPMKNQKDQTVGVLQLINCKPDPSRRFTSGAEIEREVVAYPSRFQDLVASLASQAAVALEKSRLYRELRAALEKLEASQQRIIRTERLAALGEMAGGVAHDFNNVLAIILGRAELLLDQVDDARIRHPLHVIEKAALDGAQTVKRIQEFTRMRRVRPFQAVDLNEIARGVVEVTSSRWRAEAQTRGIAYDVRLDTAPLPPVAGDIVELREALINLVFNALDAMPEGGRLTVTTAADAERVSCTVTDTGVGMGEEIRQRVFEPFFTTKRARGSGLGLSVAYGIVIRHNGEIDVQSEPGGGSAFTIHLPVGRDLPEASAAAFPETRSRALKILVIDDEPEVRQVLIDLLARQGHEVVACADGRAGLARFREEPFDLVITDLGMPGLSGWEVARLIKEHRPRTPVTLVTGWGDQVDAEEAKERGVDFLVAKPFRSDDVLAVLRRASARD